MEVRVLEDQGLVVFLRNGPLLIEGVPYFCTSLAAGLVQGPGEDEVVVAAFPEEANVTLLDEALGCLPKPPPKVGEIESNQV